MDTVDADEAPTVQIRERVSWPKILRWIAAIAALIALAVFGYRYWRESRLFVSTEDAYVNANMVEIAALVSGTVTVVHVRDNQAIGAAQPLFEIDPRNYEAALARAEAQLQLARQQVSQNSAAVAAAEALVAQREAELAHARSDERRTARLVSRGFLSQQASEAQRTQVATAVAALHTAQADLAQARSALGALGEQNAGVQAAEAAVNQARLDLEHTHVSSPTAGTIANLTLRPGNAVQPGTPLFTVISGHEFWVDANFKETELKQVRPGQSATVRLDMYPDREFQGVVESLSGGSGTAFSLLPPQNATGNWVKVTQRVPVRIRILDPDPAHPLRVGTTAKARVRVAQDR